MTEHTYGYEKVRKPIILYREEVINMYAYIALTLSVTMLMYVIKH